jgi:hypothetical protein
MEAQHHEGEKKQRTDAGGSGSSGCSHAGSSSVSQHVSGNMDKNKNHSSSSHSSKNSSSSSSASVGVSGGISSTSHVVHDRRLSLFELGVGKQYKSEKPVTAPKRVVPGTHTLGKAVGNSMAQSAAAQQKDRAGSGTMAAKSAPVGAKTSAGSAPALNKGIAMENKASRPSLEASLAAASVLKKVSTEKIECKHVNKQHGDRTGGEHKRARELEEKPGERAAKRPQSSSAFGAPASTCGPAVPPSRQNERQSSALATKAVRDHPKTPAKPSGEQVPLPKCQRAASKSDLGSSSMSCQSASAHDKTTRDLQADAPAKNVLGASKGSRDKEQGSSAVHTQKPQAAAVRETVYVRRERSQVVVSSDEDEDVRPRVGASQRVSTGTKDTKSGHGSATVQAKKAELRKDVGKDRSEERSRTKLASAPGGSMGLSSSAWQEIARRTASQEVRSTSSNDANLRASVEKAQVQACGKDVSGKEEPIRPAASAQQVRQSQSDAQSRLRDKEAASGRVGQSTRPGNTGDLNTKKEHNYICDNKKSIVCANTKYDRDASKVNQVPSLIRQRMCHDDQDAAASAEPDCEEIGGHMGVGDKGGKGALCMEPRTTGEERARDHGHIMHGHPSARAESESDFGSYGQDKSECAEQMEYENADNVLYDSDLISQVASDDEPEGEQPVWNDVEIEVPDNENETQGTDSMSKKCSNSNSNCTDHESDVCVIDDAYPPHRTGRAPEKRAGDSLSSDAERSKPHGRHDQHHSEAEPARGLMHGTRWCSRTERKVDTDSQYNSGDAYRAHGVSASSQPGHQASGKHELDSIAPPMAAHAARMSLNGSENASGAGGNAHRAPANGGGQKKAVVVIDLCSDDDD